MIKGDNIYWARIIPSLNIYELIDLKVRTVEDTWFVGYDKKDQQAYIFNNSDIDNVIFFDRGEALEYVLSKEEEKEE